MKGFLSNLFAKLSVPQIIAAGFTLIILIGTVLLYLPVSSAAGETTSLIDALFTSASAVSVTGLTVLDTTTHWSPFGKVILLILIQTGGLGFMTFVTMLFMMTGKKITLKERMIIQLSFDQNKLRGMVGLVRKALLGSLVIEGVAAIFLALRFIADEHIGFAKGIWLGVFHSISAYCSAGFAILGGDSLSAYTGDFVVCFVIILLAVIGSIGFTVWIDLLRVFSSTKDRNRAKKATWVFAYQKLTLHSKIVLEVTLLLIITGGLLFLLAEYSNPNTLGRLPFFQKVMAAFFQSSAGRTAGFSTFDQSNMSIGAKFVSVVLMFIGGSPGSTAGGIKTVNFYIIFISALSIIKGDNAIISHDRRISVETLQKVLAVTILNTTVLILATMLISLTEGRGEVTFLFIDLLYDTTSAVSTNGTTTGITAQLSSVGKLIYCLCMAIGRIGPVTTALSISIKQSRATLGKQYPEEKVLIG